MKRKIFTLVGAVTMAAMFTLPVHPIDAQSAQMVNIKIEDYPQAFKNKEPVKIIGLRLGSNKVESGEDFQANQHWLHDLRVTVKNVSDQSIRQVVLILDLPENDLHVSDPNYRTNRVEIRYGREYFFSRTPSDSVPELLLRPGEVAEIHFNSNDPDAYERHLKHMQRDHKYMLPSKGSIFLGTVVFEDVDKGWYGRSYVQRCADGINWCGDPSKADQTHVKT